MTRVASYIKKGRSRPFGRSSTEITWQEHICGNVGSQIIVGKNRFPAAAKKKFSGPASELK